MERFFPAERIVLTGNPVRQNLLHHKLSPEAARQQLGLRPDLKTILIIGGSLGARTLNESVLNHLEWLTQQEDVQILWQTGKFYSANIQERLAQTTPPAHLHVTEFVSDMSAAYAAADWASSISEICLLGKPSILVPSPNVAEDHQTHNALALVNKDAARYVTDAEAPTTLLEQAVATVRDAAMLQQLSENALQLAKPNAAHDIAQFAIALAQQKA